MTHYRVCLNCDRRLEESEVVCLCNRKADCLQRLELMMGRLLRSYGDKDLITAWDSFMKEATDVRLCQARVRELEKKINELTYYAEHRPTCLADIKDKPCTCGLSEVIGDV